MHRSAACTVLVIGAFGIVTVGLSQTPPQTAAQSLTLAQAEAIALKNHPQIAAAQNVEAAAGQRVVQTRAAYYPSLSADITASQANPLSRIGAGLLQVSSLFNHEGEGLVANQLITDLGRTKNLVASSALQAQAASQTTQATRYDVILGVNRAYYGVLQAQALVRVAEETVRTRQTLTDQITALTNAQLKSQVDLSFAQVTLSEAQLLLIRARDNLKQSFADLTRSLGQDTPPVEYALVEGAAPPALPPDTEGLVGQAIQNRPELADLRLRYEASQKFEVAERDLKKPNVSLIAVGGVLPYIDQNPRVAPEGYESVAVNVEIPIFNGHLFTAREQAARYEALAANQRLRDLQQQVEHDVRAAWLTASTARQRIPVTVQLVNQSELSLTLATGRYNLGLASIVEITQAQLNLTQAQIENVGANYDYQIAYAALQYTLGALR
jgi:outer membrane protein